MKNLIIPASFRWMQHRSPPHHAIGCLQGKGGGQAGWLWACGAIASCAVLPTMGPDQKACSYPSRASNVQCQTFPSLLNSQVYLMGIFSFQKGSGLCPCGGTGSKLTNRWLCWAVISRVQALWTGVVAGDAS